MRAFSDPVSARKTEKNLGAVHACHYVHYLLIGLIIGLSLSCYRLWIVVDNQPTRCYQIGSRAASVATAVTFFRVALSVERCRVMFAHETPRVPTLTAVDGEVLVDKHSRVSDTAKLRNWSAQLSVSSLKSAR